MGEITWGTAAATLAVPFVFLLPGWALLSLLLPSESFHGEQRPDVASRLILAVGITLSLVPIGLFLLYLAGLKVGPVAVLGTLGASAAVVLWKDGPRVARAWRREDSWRQRLARLDVPQLTLAALAVLILGVRLWVVRGINIGFWGDSYHHTVITQLFLDNGGLFQSWEPYVPLKSFAYHYGFHANTAFFQWATGWLTGNPTTRAVVLVGQVLNTYAVLALYPLGVRLSGGNRWAGVVAVLVAGLLTPSPMDYVNWGRYTQLAGQAILPVAIWLTMEAMETRRWDPRRLALAILPLAGLAVTHYRVLVLYLAFLVPYIPTLFWARRKEQSLPALGLRLASLGLLSMVLSVPWMWNLWLGFYSRIVRGYVQQTVSAAWVSEYNALGSVDQFAPYALIVLALAAALWALWRRQQMALVALWAGVAFLLTNPHIIGLPGTGLITNFALALALYIPVALLVGNLVGSGLAWMAARFRGGGLAAAGAVLLVAVCALPTQASRLDRNYQLVTPADVVAMSWIRQNTPPEARFLANGFLAYNNSVLVGSDAGWWIPFLTGRDNTVPPMLYNTEASIVPGYRDEVKELVLELQGRKLGDPETVGFLREQGITHVYAGEKGGPLLDAAELDASPFYCLLYHDGQVRIWSVRPENGGECPKF